ncbi:[pyruvate dehydrogenase (acetyl-transferring)] kinase, partial [Sarracenia purpurea var. burkii]
IKCYVQQLLHGLEHCHSRGVLHRDIKGSNLLIDNNGVLKIGDFGLATFFQLDQKQPLTSRVVTLWYMAPELLLGAKEYGVSIDLWSDDCILAELFAEKPIMPGRTEIGGHHTDADFAVRGKEPKDEVQIYTWKDATLRELTDLVCQNSVLMCYVDIYGGVLAEEDI